MKKIILIAVMAVMSVAASAQNLKFGYVNFNEIVMLMPEMDAARATMEENQKTNEEILMSMYQEYQTKMQDYQAKGLCGWRRGSCAPPPTPALLASHLVSK